MDATHSQFIFSKEHKLSGFFVLFQAVAHLALLPSDTFALFGWCRGGWSAPLARRALGIGSPSHHNNNAPRTMPARIDLGPNRTMWSGFVNVFQREIGFKFHLQIHFLDWAQLGPFHFDVWYHVWYVDCTLKYYILYKNPIFVNWPRMGLFHYAETWNV